MAQRKVEEVREYKHYILWYRAPNVGIISFRVKGADLQKKRRIMENSGFVEVQDPFKKGAPLGGWKR